jgi:hypothetical protein
MPRADSAVAVDSFSWPAATGGCCLGQPHLRGFSFIGAEGDSIHPDRQTPATEGR